MSKNKKIKIWLFCKVIFLVFAFSVFVLFFSFKKTEGQSENSQQQSQKESIQCRVENITFDPAGMQDDLESNKATWFKDNIPPTVKIEVKFKAGTCKSPNEIINFLVGGPEKDYPEAIFSSISSYSYYTRICPFQEETTSENVYLDKVFLTYRVGENNIGTCNNGSPEALARLLVRISTKKEDNYYFYDSFYNKEFYSSSTTLTQIFEIPDLEKLLTVPKTSEKTQYIYPQGEGENLKTATIDKGEYNLTLAKNPLGFIAFNCNGICNKNWQQLYLKLFFSDGKQVSLIQNGKVTKDSEKYFCSKHDYQTAIHQEEIVKETDEKIEDTLLDETKCGLGILTSKGSIIPGCFPVAFLEIITKLLNFLAYFAGKILDFFVNYTLDSANYRISYISFGWKVFRDFVNIFFIFILLYIAVNVILGLREAQKKLLVNLIIVVLLINFSLFLSRVIVDVGNSFANVIYYSMEVKGKNTLEYPSLTEAVVSNFDPYNIYKDLSIEIKASWWLYCILLITLIVLNIVLFTTFLSVAIFFLGRTVGIWIAMITAPLAFFTLVLPPKIKETSFKDFEFTKWFGNLVNMAIMPLIFLFFLYLIIKLGNPTALGQSFNVSAKTFALAQKEIGVQPISGSEKNALTSIFTTILPFMIIMALIKIAKAQAQKLAGEVAAQIKEMASKAITTAALMAVPAAGMAARGFIGAAGGITKAAGKGMEYLGKKRLFGEKISKGLEKMGAKTKSVGIGVSKAPAKVGKFMEETRVGQVLKGTGQLAGKAFGWGAEKMGIGLEKIPIGLKEASKAFVKVAPLATEYAKKIGLSEEMASRIGHNLGKYDYRTAQEEKEWIAKEKKYKMEKIKKNLSNKSDKYTKEKSQKRRDRYEQNIDKLIENYLKKHPEEQKKIEEKAQESTLKEKARLETEANIEGSKLNDEIKTKAYEIWEKRKKAGEPDADDEKKNWELAKEEIIKEKTDNFLKNQKQKLIREKAEEIFPPPKVYETTAEKNTDILKKAFEKYSQKEDRVSHEVAKEIKSVIYQKENLNLELNKKEKELNQINEIINQFKNDLQQQGKEPSVENILTLGGEKIQDLKIQELELENKIKEAQESKNFKEVINLFKEKIDIGKKIKIYQNPFEAKLNVEEDILKTKDKIKTLL